MSSTNARYRQYDEEGKSLSGGQIFLPDYLDWMPIEVKAFWFRYMGQGHADTKYVLFESQGEQRLLIDVTLNPLTHTEYKEKANGAEREVQQFIDEGGYSRVPRNQ